MRRELIERLLELYQQKLYQKLGSPTITAYTERHFQYNKTQTYEFLRVAEAIARFPKLAGAFDRGEIGWSALVEITKIATARDGKDDETVDEALMLEWLEFARTRSADRVKKAVKHARKKKDKKPGEADK